MEVNEVLNCNGCQGSIYNSDSRCGGCPDLLTALEMFTVYKDAEEHGRLVVLPCKIGDMVYWITALSKGIAEGIIYAIKISKFGYDLEISTRDKNHLVIRRELEKVFFTRSEAEAALNKKP